MRIIYSSTLSSRLGSGLHPKCDALSLPFSHFISFFPPSYPLLPHFAGSTGVISFFHLLSLSLSHFLSFPSTTETLG